MHHRHRLVQRRSVLRAAPLLIGLLAALLVACSGGAAEVPPPVIATTTPQPTATAAPTVTTTPPPATPTPTAIATPARPPEVGRWIDVDVVRYVVRLMDGTQVLREIGPVAVGREVDTGRYESTQTGLFHVYNKIAPRSFDAPYNTYIQWWVGFDPAKANGFHSFLLDEAGNVVDSGTGRISNGCIRTGEAQLLYEFAEVGMPVFVHA